MAHAVAVVLRGRNARRLGLEAEHATLEFRDKLAEVIRPGRLAATQGLVADLRGLVWECRCPHCGGRFQVIAWPRPTRLTSAPPGPLAFVRRVSSLANRSIL
jgi:hypothetical protein